MALNLLPKSKFKYRIIGQGPYKENLVNLVKKNNLKNVEFYEWTDDLSLYYSESDILIVPSKMRDLA